jgi:hypothetical protein
MGSPQLHSASSIVLLIIYVMRIFSLIFADVGRAILW